MTEKQKNLLSKYLTEENVEKLSAMSKDDEFFISKNFIDLILHMRYFHGVCGEMCKIPYYKRKPTKEEEKIIEETINSDRKRYGLVSDEYARVSEVRYLDDEHKWYVVRQEWFKGMSNSPTVREMAFKFYFDKEKYGANKCLPFAGIYNELFDMEIYSIDSLIRFFYEKSIKEEGEEYGKN